MTAPPFATVVVPTRDRPVELERCLAALDRQSIDRTQFDVVVVDDRSRDTGAVRAAVADAVGPRVVDGDGRGPAAARNRGAVAARAELVCFTDDDCEPHPEWLAALFARFEAGADVVAGPTLAPDGGSPFVRASQLVTNHLVDASSDASGAIGFAPTSNIVCRRAVHKAARFDESFPTAAGEDRAWCDRVRAAGYRIDFAPTAPVTHTPDLTARGFWRQQTRYGAGAHRYFAAHEQRARPQPARSTPIWRGGASARVRQSGRWWSRRRWRRRSGCLARPTGRVRAAEAAVRWRCRAQ